MLTDAIMFAKTLLSLAVSMLIRKLSKNRRRPYKLWKELKGWKMPDQRKRGEGPAKLLGKGLSESGGDKAQLHNSSSTLTSVYFLHSSLYIFQLLPVLAEDQNCSIFAFM